MSLEEKLQEYWKEQIARCERGIRGEEKIPVTNFNMYLTNQCNIHCIICPFISKDAKNRTYFNEPPHMVTLQEIKKILPARRFSDRLFHRPITDSKVTFVFFKGETLLNPDLTEILRYIKEQYPNSEIQILSNGTVPPPNPGIINYIDILGFSLDGGTKEIFESIRTPARFNHVKDTVEKWVILKRNSQSNIRFRCSTTLSTMNFEDLPNIAELIGQIIDRVYGSERRANVWDSIYCQPVVIESYQDPALNDITIEHVDRDKGKVALEKLRIIAQKYDIRLDIPSIIYEMFSDSAESSSQLEAPPEWKSSFGREVFCDKLENGYLSYSPNGKLNYTCCFMDKKYWREVIERYQIPDKGTPEAIYNSKGYWRLRKDMLEGKLHEECRDCTIGKSNYYEICKKLSEEG